MAVATEVIVLRIEQYRVPQMAIAKHGILSTHTNIVYEVVDNLCCITAQLIHYTNKEDNNLMHLPIEMLVK